MAASWCASRLLDITEPFDPGRKQRQDRIKLVAIVPPVADAFVADSTRHLGDLVDEPAELTSDASDDAGYVAVVQHEDVSFGYRLEVEAVDTHQTENVVAEQRALDDVTLEVGSAVDIAVPMMLSDPVKMRQREQKAQATFDRTLSSMLRKATTVPSRKSLLARSTTILTPSAIGKYHRSGTLSRCGTREPYQGVPDVSR